ncbi:MAG: TolC family protein, partial [Pseudomonadota bacterium]
MIFTFALFLFFLSPLSQASLSPEVVVRSSQKHYPQVIQAVLEVESLENKTRAARGVFDAKIKGDVDSRTQGPFDGDLYKGQIVKPIPYFNTEIYAGFRQSYDEFPDYEGKSVTGDEGETFAGISISLLRNSLIDGNRGNVQKIQQDTVQAELALNQTKIEIQTLALRAYWYWYFSGHALRVYKNILELATQ